VTTATTSDLGIISAPAPVSAPLRQVREEDLDALEKVDRDVFGDLAYDKHLLRTFFNLFREHWYVVDLDGELGGYVLIGHNSDSQEAWLLGLGVIDRYRGRGLGRKLMARADEVCSASRVRTAYITVRPDNAAAVHLYKSYGFTQEGPEKENYYGNQENRAVLRKDF
jgi:[ribosomal protein S18]-alanine N-acetyltransferase